MRKADYSLLAMLLSVEIRGARLSGDAARLELCKHLALCFVEKASVNRLAFLNACGID